MGCVSFRIPDAKQGEPYNEKAVLCIAAKMGAIFLRVKKDEHEREKRKWGKKILEQKLYQNERKEKVK